MRTAPRLAVAAVVLTGSLAAASPAAAAPTSTVIGSEATAANAEGLGGCFCNVIPISVGTAPGYAIPHAGVITRWSFRRGNVNGPDDTVRLRTYRRVDATTAPVASESTPAVVASVSGGIQTTWSRVPAATGHVLGGAFHTTAGTNGARAIYGTGSAADQVDISYDASPAFSPFTSRRVNMSAVLESDEDADGYGDVSQDLCVADGAHGASACSGTLLGSDLQGPATTVGSCVPACELAQLTTPGGASAAATAGGVIVRWRLLSPRPGSYRLRVIAPASPGPYVRGEPSAPVVVGAGAGLITTPARIPIPAGGYATLLVPSGGNPASAVPAPAGATSAVVTGDPAGGAGAPAGLGGGTAGLLHYDADVEPDADGDGFGDVTQDGCAGNAATTGACPAGSSPGPAATPGPPAPGAVATAPRVLSITRRAARFRVPRKGATFTVTTSARTKVRFTIHRLRGRRSTLVHRFTRTLKAGRNNVAYSGRYVVRRRNRKLAPGRYRVQAAAVNRAGRVGPARTNTFTVVR